MTKNNSGFAPLYIVLVLLVLASVSLNVYFFFYAPKNQPINQEPQKPVNVESKKEEVKQEPAATKKQTSLIDSVYITDYKDYYELKDTNPKTVYTLKFPKNITFESQALKDYPNRKTIISESRIGFSTSYYPDKLFSLSYRPKFIRPAEGVIFDSYGVGVSVVNDKGFDIDSFLKEQNRLFNVKIPNKTKIGDFDAYVLMGMPDSGSGHILTIIKIDEGYYLELNSAPVLSENTPNSKKHLDFYNQIVNSAQKVK